MCENATISSNIFFSGAINVFSTSISQTNIDENLWKQTATGGITITTISNTSLTFGNNITRHIHINNNSGTLIDSTLISNTLSDDLNILGNVDDCNVSNNTVANNLGFGGTISDTNISANTCNTMTCAGIVNNIAVDGNTFFGKVTYNNEVNYSSITGNKINDLTIVGTMLDDTISTNIMRLLNCTGASLDRISITANELSVTTIGVYAINISGYISASTITSINSRQGFNIVGNFSQSVMASNKGAFQDTGFNLLSNLDRSVVDGNVAETFLNVGNSNTSIISNNQIRSIQIPGYAYKSNIQDNIVSRTSLGPSIGIFGNVSESNLTGNSGIRGFQFGADVAPVAVNLSRIESNLITDGAIVTYGTSLSSSYSDNFASDSIIITGVCTGNTMSGNRTNALSIDSTNSGNCVNNVLSANVLNTNIAIGSVGAPGISGNVISGNVALTSITTVASSTGNLITSNRCPSVVGFGGAGNLVVANI